MRPDVILRLHSLFLPAARSVGEAVWHPSADVYRTRAGWLVKFDLAGVRPEDVQLTTRGRRLTVAGRRRDWCLEEGCCHYQLEISYSHFERCLELPCDLDHAHLSAEHRHGMLLVRIELEAAE